MACIYIVYSIKTFLFFYVYLLDIVNGISSGPRPVCVLSTTGVLSSVVIHHCGPSSTTKYDVRLTCELLSTFVKKLEI